LKKDGELSLSKVTYYLKRVKKIKRKKMHAEEIYKRKQIEVMNRLLSTEDSIRWDIVNEKISCEMNEDMMNYFNFIAQGFHEDENLFKEIKKCFISDVKMSLLMDEALKINRNLGNKLNNDRFRDFFETLNALEEALNKKYTYGNNNIETNLYLKSIDPFIKFVLMYSKKDCKNLIDKFNGFKLVNSKLAKSGENKIYVDYQNISKIFFSHLNESSDRALCLQFFDTYTDYIDMHYLAEEIRYMEILKNNKDIDFKLMILTKIRSPLMKNALINSVYDFEGFLRIELLEAYNLIFDKCKKSLKECFISTEEDNKKETLMLNNFEKYKRIYSLLGNDEQFEQLVDELMVDLSIVEKCEENLDPYDREAFREKIFGVPYSYSINHFGEAYRMIYDEKKKEKNQK